MNAAKLVFAFIARNPLTWAFHVVMLSVGVAIVLSVMLVSAALNDRLTRDLAGVDLVVGAKGSPTQMILSTLFATDMPTGNIPLSVADTIMKSPLVREAVTLSLGDSAKGYRIVGTQPKLADFYQAKLTSGRFWDKPMEVVLGSEVARVSEAQIGTTFVGQHGLIEGGEDHGEAPYKVVGILGVTGSAIDRMILTDTKSVWDVHAHEATTEADGVPHNHDQDQAKESEARQVTAVLVRYKSAMGAVMMPRQISTLPDIQAAIPAREAARLTAITGTGSTALQGLGIGLLGLSALGFCVALGSAVHQRRSELALMRVLGIAPVGLVGIVLIEAIMLGFLSGLVGVALGRAITWYGAAMIGTDGGIVLMAPAFGILDMVAVVCAITLAILAALIPCIGAYRTDPAMALTGEIG